MKKFLILLILITGLFINLLPVIAYAQGVFDTGATATGTTGTSTGNSDLNTPAPGLDPINTSNTAGLSNQGDNTLPTNQNTGSTNNANTGAQTDTSASVKAKAPGILVLPDPLNLNADISKAPGQLVTRLTNIFLGLVGIGAVVVIIYGGSLYLFSMGDNKKAEKGRKVLEYAIIGLAIILGAYIIINTALSVLTQVTK